MAVLYEESEKGSVETVNAVVPAENIPTKLQCFRTCSPQYLFLILMLVTAILVSLVTLVVFLVRSQPVSAAEASPEAQIKTTTTNYAINSFDDLQEETTRLIDLGVNTTLLPKLKIVSRREWLAQPPAEKEKPLAVPVPYVFIMDTATEDCTNQASCAFHVRFLQSYHSDSRGFDDIAYNFLIGGDGFAYEGRGWRYQGAHTYGYNSKSIGIALIGRFNHTAPPERQIIATKQLINIGLEKDYIDPNFKLLTTRQVESTKTPGLALYEDLQKWPHWAEQP